MSATDQASAAAARVPLWRSWPGLLVAWAVSRWVLVAVGLWDVWLYPAGPLAFDDLDVYGRWVPTLSAGTLPTDDMWQYPPLSALFFWLGALGSDPGTTLMIAIIGVDLILTLVLARHRLAAGWWWVLFGLMIGPVLVSRFDVVPTLFAVLAVLAAARPLAAGAWAAVGAGLKVWPVLVLPVVARRDALRAGAAFVITTIALLAITAMFFNELTGFLGGQGNRGLQVESVGALPFLIANSISGGVDLEYRYGSMEVAQDGAGLAAVIVSVIAVVGLVWVVVAWFRGRFENRPAADVAFTVVLFSVVVSRVFSPQYSVWLLGLGALCLVASGSRVRIPVALVAAAAVIAQVLYPWGYGRLLAGEPILVALQATRIALVVVAAGWCWYQVVLRPRSDCVEGAQEVTLDSEEP